MKFVEDGGHILSDLRYTDRGRSAFKGDKQTHLGEFLKILRANDGRIKKGDILFVEAIDRLSRKGIRDTQKVVNEILDAGVSIAITMPIAKVYSPSKVNELGDSIELSAFAFAAHTYSANLSERVKGFHKRSRERARKDLTPINSARPPSWLIREGGKFRIKPGADKIIKKIFDMVVEGHGTASICKYLNQNHECFSGQGTVWNNTFVRMLTADPRVMGEFQPKETDEKGKLFHSGEPVKGYYPVILSEEQFLLAARARKNRLKERGPSGDFVNIFTGIVFHAVDKVSCQLSSYQKYNAAGELLKFRRLQSTANRYKSGNYSTETVDVEHFEQAVLRYLRGLDLSVFNGNGHQNNDDLQNLILIQDEKKSRLAEIEEALTGSKNLKFLITAGAKLQDEIEQLEKEIDELKSQNLNNPSQALAQVQTLADLDNTPENRQKLREAIKRVVSRIVILPVKLGKNRSSPIGCLIEIELLNGTRQSIMQLLGASMAFSDMQPTGTSLFERPKILQYKEKVRAAFVKLFMKR